MSQLEEIIWSDGSDDLKGESSDKSIEDSDQMVLKLGDIIELISPANAKYHQKTFYINYIDDSEIEILDVNSGFKHILSLYDSGELTDESIKRIHLLSRAPEEGYAKQNGLLVGKWIDVYFNSEVPTIITGEITNLDEDMIEVMTYPDMEMIYLNFEYKGVPRIWPIEKIVLRETPKSIKGSLRKMKEDLSEEGEIPNFDSSKTASMESMPNGEIAIIVPDNPKMDPNFNDTIKDLVFSAKDIVFGEDVDLEIRREVKRSEQRYGIDIQLNDLMDELLSTIPTNKRTERVKQRVKTIVSRFKELREQFSNFDANGNVTGYKNFDAAYKPLVQHLEELDVNLRWILPVVKQQTKLYVVNNDEEPENDYIDNRSNVFDILEMIEKRNLNETYSSYYENINENFTPFLTLENGHKKEVKCDLEMILDNLDNYYSNTSTKVFKMVERGVAKTNEVINRRFIIQKYNLGMSKMHQHTMKSGKTVYIRGAMTQNDVANVKSILLLPKEAVKFSRVDLPGTGVIDRVNLSHNWLYYFNLLRSQTNVETLSAKKPIDYEEIEGAFFASKMIGFAQDAGNHSEFLNNVIPRSRSIIRMLRDEVPNPYSFYNMISFYEPFLLYSDNITYSAKTAQDKRNGDGNNQKGGAYNEIRFHVKEMVKKYKADMASRGSEFGELSNRNYDRESKRIPNVIYRVLNENNEFLKAVTERYKLAESGIEGTETLNRIIALDNGAAYMSTIALMLGSLYKPDLAKMVANLENDDGSGAFEFKHTISKKYTSVRDMQKDNNTEDVWFDKDYDNTPYAIMSKYAEDQKKMLPDKFIDYLKMILIEKHDANPETADELAMTLIAKKRRVKTGNYAILEIVPTPVSNKEIGDSEKEAIEIEKTARKKTSFYVRSKNIWVRDEDADEREFEVYEDVKKSEKRIDKIIEYAVGNVEENMKNRAKYHMNLLKKIGWIKESNAKKQDIYAYMLGTQIIESGFGIQSPYEGLRDYILGQSDIVKRSADILRFRDNFCREGVNDEPLQWLYCVDTNVKLLPKFFYDLAHCYVNGNDYEAELDRICRHSGKLSEDQESIVDKHSGYVIKNIDFADDMGYFKSVEGSSADADIQHVLGRKTKSGKKVFEDETTQHIYNIASALCEYMSVDFDLIDERIMQLSVEFVKGLDSPDAYKAKQEKAAKKNIKIASYQTYVDQNKIYYTGCVTFVAIQTAVPSFKPKKTFPGCVFSFGGYPLEAGEENTVGLKYVACVIDNIKSQVAPWNSISNQKRDGILTRLMELMTKRVTLHPTVADLYLRKKEQPAHVDEIPPTLDVSKWTHFQPPIIKFSMLDKKTSPGVSAEFRDELAQAMKKGHSSQRNLLGTIFQKIIGNSYSVVEAINKVVATAGKDAILRAGTIVFLENACCEDNGQSTAIDFFKAANPNIQKHIDITNAYGMIYTDSVKLCRAPYLFYPKIEGKKSPLVLKDKYSEEAIYEAFIHYCKLNVDAPVPDDLERFYQKDDKPLVIKGMDLPQTIENMKKLGHVHTNKSLEDLMKIIAHRNVVHLDKSDEITNPVMGLSDLLEHLLEKETIDQPLYRILKKLIDQYLKNVLDKKDAVNELKQYLQKTNRNMLAVITKHVVDGSSMNTREKNKIKTFLTNVGSWTSQNETEVMYKSAQFMRGCIHFITKVVTSSYFDNFMDSEKLMHKNAQNIDHWGFSENHRKEILKFVHIQFAKLNSFVQSYKEDNADATMTNFLKNNADLLINLNLFANNIPLFADQSILLDREAVQLLHIYIYYSIFHDLIIESDNDIYVKMEMVHIKKMRRNAEDPDEFSAVEDIEEADDDLLGADEYDIVMGKQQDFKKRVCEFLTTLIEIDMENKSTVNVSYTDLLDKVYKSGKAEKKTITDRFETLDAEERGVENMLKTYSIGAWNVGNEKGLFKYDANTYDKEVSGQMMANTATEVNDLQADMEAQADAEADREANDISGLGDNFMDGAYYEEDADRDE